MKAIARELYAWRLADFYCGKLRSINLTSARGEIDYRKIDVVRYVIQWDRNAVDVIQTQNVELER